MEPISSDFLKEVSGEFDLELIFKLDLTSYGKSNPLSNSCGEFNFFLPGISELGSVSQCKNIEWLDLSSNDIYRLYPLSTLSKLTFLDLSNNKIQSLGLILWLCLLYG